MIFRDEILVGNGSIGNYVVGFFNCQADDGETAENQILKAYQRLGYWNIKPIFSCLDAVQHEGLNERMPTPEGWEEASSYAEESVEEYLNNISEFGLAFERVTKIRLHRHQVL